jgi:hypothetical protein
MTIRQDSHPGLRLFSLDIILSFIGGTATVTVLLMLAFTFHYRVNRQAAWEQMEQVGQFWNGIFSPFALFALITGLYFQQRQMQEQQRKQDEDRQHFEDQMNLLRADQAQRSFELAKNQLQEYAEELLYELPDTNGTSKKTRKGLNGILRIIDANEDDDLLNQLVVDRQQLKRYMKLAAATESLLDGLPATVKVAAASYLDRVQPTSLSNMVQQIEEARAKCLSWIKIDFSRSVDDEIRAELDDLVNQEWLFDKIAIRDEIYVTAVRLKPGAYQVVKSRKMTSVVECCRDAIRQIKHPANNNHN